MHVERFFSERFHHVTDKAHWQLGVEVASLLEFHEWYKINPLLILLDDDEIRAQDPSFEPITVEQASSYLGCSRDSIQKAAKDGGLTAWRPRGGVWYTNRYELQVWRERCPVGGIRVGAGRKKKAA
jgi:excisionase family DNA binding protein